MPTLQTIFGQLTDHLSRAIAGRLRYRAGSRLRTFSCWDQFFRTARQLYRDDPFGLDLDETVYALDATTIDLCLSLCPWARFQAKHGAVKLHTLLDLRGNIPTFVRITHGKVADVEVLDHLVPEAGSFYVMDRGYLDFARLFRLTCASAYFVTRTKRDVLLTRRYSRPVDFATGVRSDHTVIVTTVASATHYPDPLRRIPYVDPEREKRLVFLTNNFALPALTIAQLYKARWQVETYASHCTSFAA